jgi:RNA polymerase sigma-70 factor (ECF subfamily)
MRAASLTAELARRGITPPAGLAALTAKMERAARAAWPNVDLDGETFFAYLTERWPETVALDRWLADAHATDLYLACACAHGVDGALAAFDRAHLGMVADYLARSRPDAAFVDDVRQSLREKLFVGERPKIHEYSGRGPLGGWVRVLAVRAAIDLRRRRGERVPDLRGEEPSPIDPELGYLAQRYRVEVEDAFARALAVLDGEQRTLLRMHFVDAVTLDELARLKNLHRATIARRLAAARKSILEETRRQLRERLSLSTDELHSLVRFVRSQLDVSVARMLAS